MATDADARSQDESRRTGMCQEVMGFDTRHQTTDFPNA